MLGNGKRHPESPFALLPNEILEKIVIEVGLSCPDNPWTPSESLKKNPHIVRMCYLRTFLESFNVKPVDLIAIAASDERYQRCLAAWGESESRPQKNLDLAIWKTLLDEVSRLDRIIYRRLICKQAYLRGNVSDFDTPHVIEQCKTLLKECMRVLSALDVKLIL